jgi:transcriptional regulator with XRE-family HTH domain
MGPQMSTKHDPRHIRLRELLRAARKQAKLSQVEVAKSLRRPQSFLSKVEKGERTVDAIDMLVLARLYGISPDSLSASLDGSDDSQYDHHDD